MRRLANMGAEDIRVRSRAVDITRDLKQKDYRGEACACLDFTRDQIRYVRDIRNVETLHHAWRILDIKAGDCDDKAILLASLLASIGHRVRFIAVAFATDRFSHVWLQDFIQGKWLDLEPTEPIPCGIRIPSKGQVDVITCEL